MIRANLHEVLELPIVIGWQERPKGAAWRRCVGGITCRRRASTSGGRSKEGWRWTKRGGSRRWRQRTCGSSGWRRLQESVLLDRARSLLEALLPQTTGPRPPEPITALISTPRICSVTALTPTPRARRRRCRPARRGRAFQVPGETLAAMDDLAPQFAVKPDGTPDPMESCSWTATSTRIALAGTAAEANTGGSNNPTMINPPASNA